LQNRKGTAWTANHTWTWVGSIFFPDDFCHNCFLQLVLYIVFSVVVYQSCILGHSK